MTLSNNIALILCLNPVTDSTPTDDPIVSPNGSPIIGTEETLTACALATFRWEDGRVAYDYAGETECDWDNQRTLTTSDGKELLRDENGVIWPSSQCMPLSHWQARRGPLDTYVFCYRKEYTPEHYLAYCAEADHEPTPNGWHDWVLEDIAEDVGALPGDGLMNYVQQIPAASKAPG